jgi:putative tricarboxylic transport membrane protein
MLERTSIGDLVVGIGIVCFAGVVGWETIQIADGAIYARVGPAVFPWIVTIILVVLGSFLVMSALSGGWSHEDPSGDLDLPSLAWLAAALLANVLLIDHVGFIIASTIMFVLAARSFGSRTPLRDRRWTTGSPSFQAQHSCPTHVLSGSEWPADHALPSHFATRLAAVPPAEMKLPPA